MMTYSDFGLDLPCGVRLSAALTEVSLLATLPDVASSRRDVRTGWVWYGLPKWNDGDYAIGMGLGFNFGTLKMIQFSDNNPKFGANWKEWSEDKERLRAKSTERWLNSKGIVVGSHSWGGVWAGFDTKGGYGSAMVRLGV